MNSLLVAVFWVVHNLISLMIFLIIAAAVWSWLIAFNVVNTRNPFIYQVDRFLRAVTRPVLWPFRKIIPPLGGVDITPVIAILVLQGIQIGLGRLEVSMFYGAPY